MSLIEPQNDIFEEFKYDLKIIMGDIDYRIEKLGSYIKIEINTLYSDTYIGWLNKIATTANKTYGRNFKIHPKTTLPLFFVKGNNIIINFFRLQEDLLSQIEEDINSFIRFYEEEKYDFLRREHGNI